MTKAQRWQRARRRVARRRAARAIENNSKYILGMLLIMFLLVMVIATR